MGGAILITLGVLFMLEEYRFIPFDRTWPVLLIVIGVLSYATRTASTEGHRQPRWMGGDTPPTSGTQDNSSSPDGDQQVKL